MKPKTPVFDPSAILGVKRDTQQYEFQIHRFSLTGDLGKAARAACEKSGLKYAEFVKACVIFAMEHMQ